jgi:hypothetical protein
MAEREKTRSSFGFGEKAGFSPSAIPDGVCFTFEVRSGRALFHPEGFFPGLAKDWGVSPVHPKVVGGFQVKPILERQRQRGIRALEKKRTLLPSRF